MNPQETSLLATMAVRIIYSAIILAAGVWAGKILAHLVRGALERRKTDPTLAIFLGHLINASLITFAIIAALSQLGIETMSIVAVVGATFSTVRHRRWTNWKPCSAWRCADLNCPGAAPNAAAAARLTCGGARAARPLSLESSACMTT